MLLLFLSLSRPTFSQISHICVCHASECENLCQKSAIGESFETVQPSDFEKYIIDQFNSSRYLFRKIDVYVTFNDHQIQFNLSSFNNLRINFHNFINSANISNHLSKIYIKIINDIDISYAQLTFFQSDVIISNSILSNTTKAILNLGSLHIKDGSTLSFENEGISTILQAKCCSLNDFSLMVFDEIYLENGYCSEDFSLTASSIHKLQFDQLDDDKIVNYFLIINDKVKVYNALKLKIEALNNSNLTITSLSSNLQDNTTFSLNLIPQIFLNSFDQICFENNDFLHFIYFYVNNTKSIICKTDYLSADLNSVDLYLENDLLINGTVDNISIFSNHNSDKNKIILTLKNSQNHLDIKSSFIDVNIIHLYLTLRDPINFCVGKGGISKVTIESIEIKSNLTVDESFQNLYLNRDFQIYLSDSEIKSFLYKYIEYLEIFNYTLYPQSQQYEADIIIKYTNYSYIHGFTDFDSILTPIEISNDPKIFAIYFDSPNKKLLKICLTSDSSVDNIANDCFSLNIFSNDFLQFNLGVENVLIDISKNYEYNQLSFESFFIKNLYITADYKSNVQFGSLNFIGKVTSNLTITNLHNCAFNITPKQQISKAIIGYNIDNICIFNCTIADLTSGITEKIIIDNLSICQFLEFPINWEIKNLNYLCNYTDFTYIIASYSKELLFVSTFGFVNLSNYENFNIYFPFFVNQNQDNSAVQSNLYMFLSTEKIPSFNIYTINNDASILLYKWDDIPSIFDDYYTAIANEISIISSSNSVIKDSNQPFSIHHFDYDINLFYSMALQDIDFNGSGHVSNSLLFQKKQTLLINSPESSESLDLSLNEISFEEVFVNFNQDENSQSTNPEINFSSIREKIVHFVNFGSCIQKVCIYENSEQSSLNDINSPSYQILLDKVQLTLKRRQNGPIIGVKDEDDLEENESPFQSLFLEEVELTNGASLKGFNAQKTTFRKLFCTFNDIWSLGDEITIKEKLTIYGEIDRNSESEKTILFSPKSLLRMILNDQEIKILIGERLIRIGPFEFVGVDHVEIILNVDKNSGFNLQIEPAKNEFNFDLYPNVSIIQRDDDNDQFKKSMLLNDQNYETYKFINIKTRNNKNIRKGINEKIAHKFQRHSKKFDFSKSSEKVVRNNTPHPSQFLNSIKLIGDWTGCNSKFVFFNLSDVNFYSDSETVPFHFISTSGDINIYVNKERTNFLGNFLCSNTKKSSIQINILSINNIKNDISKNVTFCGIFGSSIEIQFHICQPKLHVCFNKIDFKQNLMKIHLFMSVDGYSTFSILEGSSHVDRIIYLNFDCSLELTDPKIKNFLDEKEKIIGLFIDPSFSSRIILGWDIIPKTHGLFESFELHFSRRTRKLIYLMRQSPFDVPLSVCFSEYDTCDVNIPAENNLEDIRPLIPKGKNSILMLLTESIDSVLNLDYSFFDNFSIYIIGYGIIDMNIKLGFSHVSELDLSSVSVVICDNDNYSIESVSSSSGSRIKNINGIKNLEFKEFYDFKSNKIESFKNRIIIPSESDQIVFQKDGVQIKSFDISDSSFQFKSSNFPNLTIKFVDPDAIFGKPNSNAHIEFLVNDDINYNSINKISIAFDKEVTVSIGKGWDEIQQTSIFNSIEGISNVKQITTESFPFQPFIQLINQRAKDAPFYVYPDNALFPILVPEEFTLFENESISLNFSKLLNDNVKPNISFDDVLIMNDRTKIQIFDDLISKQRINNDLNTDDYYIKMDHLVVSRDSSAFVSSAKITNKLEMKENSNLFGNFLFDINSTLIINGGFNIYIGDLVKFPSIIFDSHPVSIPSKIIINIYEDTDINYIFKSKTIFDYSFDNRKYIEIKKNMQALNSLEKTPGVFISNLGFSCSAWRDAIEITSNYSFLKPSCINGFLKIANEKESISPTIVITPNSTHTPKPTPFKINISEYAHPTMTPIVNNRNNQLDNNFVQSFMGVIIVGSIFLVFILILFIVVFNLKKKYNKLSEIRDEDENNYSIHVSDDVIKL